MSLKTKLLELFKYEPDKDGAQTFNIKSALNDNWDKIEAWAQSVKTALAKLVPTSRTVNGKALSADVTQTGENIAVSTADPTPISDAVKYRTNPNLLDNWYFGRPVNQRGKVEHSGAAAEYFIDRWRCGGYVQTIRATNDGLVWDTDTGVWLTQKIEDEATLMGKTCTLSAIVNGELYSVTGKYGEGNSSIVVAPNVYYEMNHDNGGVRFVSYTMSNAGNITILAAKLELGDTQTLAHKENGVWMLNEIPDFGEQLRRCMYYAEKVEDGNTPVITNATFIPDGATSATFVLPYERKRTYPSIRFNDVSNYRVIARSVSGNTTAFGISNISILDVGTTKASVLVTFSSATSQDCYGYLQRSDTTTGGYAFISADL